MRAFFYNFIRDSFNTLVFAPLTAMARWGELDDKLRRTLEHFAA